MNDTDLEQHLRALRPASPAPALESRVREELGAGAAQAGVFRWTSGLLVQHEKTPRPAREDASSSTSGLLARGREALGAALGGRCWRDLGWAVAGALAAWAVLATLSPETRQSAPPQQGAARPADGVSASVPADAFEHAAATEELLATEDAPELIETAEGLVRPVRYSYRERHAWANPLTGARMEIEVPREEVYLIPVALQ